MSTYFQFPLSLLAFGADPKGRLECIISWCVANVGDSFYSKLEPEEVEEKVEAYKGRAAIGTPLHQHKGKALALGQSILGINGGEYHSMRARADRLDEFRRSIEAKQGNPPLVRVLTDLFFEVREGKASIDYRDFSALCAVNAAIGSKIAGRVTRDRVRAGALGYHRPADLFDDLGEIHEAGKVLLASRQDKAVPMSPKQARTALDRLEARKFFSRFMRDQRTVFFSWRLPGPEQIGEHILAQISKRTDNSERCEDLRKQIQEKRKGLLSGQSIKRPCSGPTDPDGAATGPLRGQLGAATGAATRATRGAA